jgi:hypothetical protein
MACRSGSAFGWIVWERNGFLSPVLKHGPRSLTYVRVQGCQTYVRNESISGWKEIAQSTGLNPSGERSECEHTC